MSLLLAVDTSTRWSGLALYDGGQVQGESWWQTRSHHSVELAPAVERLLRQADVSPSEIDCFATALGPGSFTSLRIGLAFVKGLALATRLPLVGIPTLDILTAALPPSDLPLAALLTAGRGRLALVWYDWRKGKWVARGEPQVTTAQELSDSSETPILICGEMTADDRAVFLRKKRVLHLATPAQSVRRPSFLAELAWERWKAGKTDDPVSLSPIYLHVAGAIPE